MKRPLLLLTLLALLPATAASAAWEHVAEVTGSGALGNGYRIGANPRVRLVEIQPVSYGTTLSSATRLSADDARALAVLMGALQRLVHDTPTLVSLEATHEFTGWERTRVTIATRRDGRPSSGYRVGGAYGLTGYIGDDAWAELIRAIETAAQRAE